MYEYAIFLATFVISVNIFHNFLDSGCGDMPQGRVKSKENMLPFAEK
jgi:hypothetical protein